MKRVLLTGVDGFIGHHVLEFLLENTDYDVVGLSRIDGASTLHRLTDGEVVNKHLHRFKFVFHDLRSSINDYVASRIGPIDYVLHLAASTHVDRSIECPMEFVQDNVVGTCNLLDYARGLPNLSGLIYFSTDEVFGPAPPGVNYQEWDRYKSSNPYAATKAGGEELAYAYHNTYGLPALMTHTMNVFGTRQHPEKFIPKIIRAVLRGEKVIVHSSPDGVPGSRFYINASNVAAALTFLMEQGEPGDKYNIVGEKEVDNLSLARSIADILSKPLQFELVDFHSARPGHDLRYALDGGKLASMGFRMPQTFEQSLEWTVMWYLAHPEWLLVDDDEVQLFDREPAGKQASKTEAV